MAEVKPSGFSLLNAAKYYIRIAAEKPLYALIPVITTGVGSVLVIFAPSIFVAKVLDGIGSSSISLESLITPVMYVGLCMLLGEILWRIGLHYLNIFETMQMQRISESTFSDLIHRPMGFHNDRFAGALVTRSSRLTRNFEGFYDTFVFNIVDIIATLIFVGIILIPRAPLVYLSFYVIIAVYLLISWPVIKKRSAMNKVRSESESAETAALADALTNTMAIKAFAQEEFEIKRYHQATQRVREARFVTWQQQNWRVDTITAPFYIMINVVSLLLAVIAQKEWGAPTSTVFLSFNYFALLSRNIWGLNRLWRNIESNLSEAAETLATLADPEKLEDIDSPVETNITNGHIEFKNVGFRHKEVSDRLFNRFNLEIKPNERVGLVGPSGGGKTTVINLLLRFMDIERGAIYIDGHDISQMRQKDLRQSIAYVPQEPILFHRSLLENIRYGKPTATKAEVINAAKLAHAHEFINKLSDNYDTLVGERGVKLSGGQRQRVAIARALVKNSPVLVLDEATSALDSESEKLIQDALWNLMKNRTAIVVAHRLSTIQKLDRIIVLDKGRVAETGTHQQLLANKGIYAKLWAHQSGGFIEE